jgi:hypothetical protein
MQIRKIVKLKINNENLEELEKLLAIWRYSVIQKRKEININNPNILTTYKNSLKQFNNFEIPAFHPIAFNTGFSIDFENNRVYITHPEKKYHRISLKVDEENMMNKRLKPRKRRFRNLTKNFPLSKIYAMI